jgi:HAD superfamily hydrolase (TIGR01509 family)
VARPARPELVIFDCDGVLVDSEPISNGVLAEMLGEQGLSITVAETRRAFQGLLLEQVLASAEQMIGRRLPAGWLEEFVSRRAEAFRSGLRPVPGAAALVEQVIAAGLPVCVASQGRLSKTAGTLSLTGLDRLFGPDVRFSAEQVAHGKPAPDLFLFAAERMGAAPSACAVIEDTPSGVIAAVSAGMLAYGYAGDSDEAALRAAGARTAESLTELGDLLLG